MCYCFFQHISAIADFVCDMAFGELVYTYLITFEPYPGNSVIIITYIIISSESCGHVTRLTVNNATKSAAEGGA